MRIRSIEKADREFFIDRCHAFYRTSACDHEIPQQNAERTFELLMHGTPYADCLIAEDDDGTPCAYCLLALTWSNEAGGLCVWLDELMVDDEQRGKGIGSQLAEKTLKDIEKQGLRLVPLCPFVAGYIHKHPEWKRIVMRGIHIK